jgi:hypothetical protein
MLPTMMCIGPIEREIGPKSVKVVYRTKNEPVGQVKADRMFVHTRIKHFNIFTFFTGFGVSKNSLPRVVEMVGPKQRKFHLHWAGEFITQMR